MRVIPFLVGLTLALVAPLAQAQGSFEPVITVNGRVITGYELDQRVLFLDILRVPLMKGEFPGRADAEVLLRELRASE